MSSIIASEWHEITDDSLHLNSIPVVLGAPSTNPVDIYYREQQARLWQAALQQPEFCELIDALLW